ncbi:hypothetical protein NT6N_39780 [Oceaniferula spumae]|uniref:Benzylsuccinate synthase n=1 Tax=Oceaniferula spumae TaxID=2979115 RepID=A0AAT9FSM5_9BACT
METMTKDKTCAKCKYWDNQNGGDSGQCRRSSPQAVVFKVDSEMEYKSVFPNTNSTDWCGEFEEK